MTSLVTTFRPDAKEIKEKYSLVELTNKFGFSFEEGYNNKCPFCGRSKLSVNHSYFYCFRTSCEGNKGGDIFNLLQKTNIADSFNSAYNLVLNELGYKVEKGHQIKKIKSRSSILEEVFKIYNQYTNTQTWDYLLDRGFRRVLEEIPIGFSPRNNLLQSFGLSEEDLDKAGLLSRSRKELFYNHIVFPIYDSFGHLSHLQGRNLDESSNLRWVNTRAEDYLSITNYLFNRNNISNSIDKVYLSEGLSDGFTLIELLGKEKVVSCIGTSPDLSKDKELFSSTGELLAIFDNDCYIDEYSYSIPKSWSNALKPLLNLKLNFPELDIYCISPPNKPYITDINDWYLRENLTLESFIEYTERNKTFIFDFVLSNFPVLQFHDYLVSYICEWEDNTLERKLNESLEQQFNSYTDYIKCLRKDK